MRKTIARTAGLVLLAAGGRFVASAQELPTEFKNLQVLDKNITQTQLKATMEGFTDQLGVTCKFCHVVDQWEKDDVRHKLAARRMIALVQLMRANKEKYFKPNVKDNQIDCGICHRGKGEPEPFAP